MVQNAALAGEAPSLARPSSGERRYVGIDALRGLAVAGMLLVNDVGDWDHVYPWLEHSAWHGFSAADAIFPLFLCVMGVSAALSLPASPPARAAPTRRVLARALRLVLLGLALHLLAHWLIPGRALRLPGVLQRIGVCFAGVGLARLWLRPAAQWTAIGLLLAGHAALLALGGSLAPDLNLSDRIDSAVWGAWAYRYDALSGHAHDPEGLLGTLGALATSLLGLRAGDFLRHDRLGRIAATGAACLAGALALAPWLPWNKALWTPSFALGSAGIGLLLAAAAVLAVDRRGLPALGRVFGANAILAYAGAWIAVCLLAGLGWLEPLYRALFADWMTPRFGPYLPSLAWAVAFTAAFWLPLRALDRRGLHLRL